MSSDEDTASSDNESDNEKSEVWKDEVSESESVSGSVSNSVSNSVSEGWIKDEDEPEDFEDEIEFDRKIKKSKSLKYDDDTLRAEMSRVIESKRFEIARVWLTAAAKKYRDIDRVFRFVNDLVESTPSVGWRRDRFFLYTNMDDEFGLIVANVRSASMLRIMKATVAFKWFKDAKLQKQDCVLTGFVIDSAFDHESLCRTVIKMFFEGLVAAARTKQDKAEAVRITKQLIQTAPACQKLFDAVHFVSSC